jgi:hypothetical protein
MRCVLAAAVSLVLIGSHATADPAPLPPGKPAGVHKAMTANDEGYLLIGAGIVSAILISFVVKFSAASTTGTSS